MDQTSFQNGFICGMATKGLVRSGELYQPIIWNDSGMYSYFYIDFKRVLQAFSLGMWNESIIVFDSQQITVSSIAQVSSTVYKVSANIAGMIHGVTVLNKETTLLRFFTGEVLPVFSLHMFVAGQTSFIDGGYLFESEMVELPTATYTESDAVSFWTAFAAGYISESVTFSAPVSSITENPTVTLT